MLKLIRLLTKVAMPVQHRALSSKVSDVSAVFEGAYKFPNKVALYDHDGSYTYGNILQTAKNVSQEISKKLDGKNKPVMFLCANDVNYLVTLWAIWMAEQIAVPLSPLHPDKILKYYAEDTQSSLFVTIPQFQNQLQNITTKATLLVLKTDYLKKSLTQNSSVTQEDILSLLPKKFEDDKEAFILYTSGTTGNPKGVVLTHKNIDHQIKILPKSWKWTSDDVVLHTLPLHHIHGTANALFSPLHIGATTIMLPKFSAAAVWSQLLGRTDIKEKVSVFMAVPTIYARLIEEYEKSLKNSASEVREYLQRNVKLMLSGSAPLPTPLYEKWHEVTGHRLLERYGMTEICMCLSNEFDSDREPGYVGIPLPGVSVRLIQKDTDKVLVECRNNNGKVSFDTLIGEDPIGELQVKGASVFKEYLNKPEATKKEFTEDGWFKTGDISQYVSDKKRFRMLGRSSVDIIKSGGYKISALQIETQLLAHPEIKEIAVLGVPDEVYGERVAAVVVLINGASLTLEQLKKWALEKLPKYTIPTVLKIVNEIPKNAMGKVNKKDLLKHLF